MTTPVDGFIVAIDVVTDDHTPPASPPVIVRLVVAAGQTVAVPDMLPALGAGLTDIVATADMDEQALVSV